MPKEVVSPFGASTFIASKEEVLAYGLMPEKRVVSVFEARELGNLKLNEDEIDSLDKILKNLSKIGYFTTDVVEGSNINVIKSHNVRNYVNTYKVQRSSQCENSAIVTGGNRVKFLFGCRKVMDSQFSIKCHSSGPNLNRCFELDSCNNCSDVYFSHNCEGLQEAMFCFNTKSKRYAIGNKVLSPEKYKEIKSSVLEQLSGEIEKNKDLKWNIYNIGCAK